MRKKGKFLQNETVVLRGVANLAIVLRGSKSNEGLTFVTLASESLCAGEFTLSTQLIKPNYLVDCEEFGTPRMLIKLIE